jgi:hypothetical protein
LAQAGPRCGTQTVKDFSGAFVVTPSITIRDRLRVLLPSEPDNHYYQDREIVPPASMPPTKPNSTRSSETERRLLYVASTSGESICC